MFRRLMREVLVPVAVAFALAFVIQAAVAKPYEIPTESMVPTIKANDKIIANRLIYRFRDIERGDIIVFTPPPSARATCGEPMGDVPFVKRVIGLAGDRVEVRGGVTYVNGTPFVVKAARRPSYTMPPVDVPKGQLFVLGDNRDGSCDSHQWTPSRFVPTSSVIGEAEITYWPLDHIAFLN
jgi:signal peptidase I